MSHSINFGRGHLWINNDPIEPLSVTIENEWVWVEGYKGTDKDMCCRGYQYELDDAQQAEYMAMFDEMFREEFAALYASSKYSNADAEKRKDLVAELRREVAEDVKRAIARLLRQQGVKSTKK